MKSFYNIQIWGIFFFFVFDFVPLCLFSIFICSLRFINVLTIVNSLLLFLVVVHFRQYNRFFKILKIQNRVLVFFLRRFFNISLLKGKLANNTDCNYILNRYLINSNIEKLSIFETKINLQRNFKSHSPFFWYLSVGDFLRPQIEENALFDNNLSNMQIAHKVLKVKTTRSIKGI